MNSKFMFRLFAFPVVMLLMALSYAGFDNELENNPAIHFEEKVYPEHLTGTFTGGFGEETCRSCHFDYELNPDGGSLSISGIPEKLSAGEIIEVNILVERKELEAAGFQFSARFDDGSQAGKFLVEDNQRIMFSKSAPDSMQYVQHSNKGTSPSAENESSWTVQWRAPEPPKGTVVFNISVNAANGDQSEFGDYIYTEEIKVSF